MSLNVGFDKLENRPMKTGPLPWDKSDAVRRITDVDDIRLFSLLQETIGLRKRADLDMALAIHCDDHAYDPLQDMLNALKWDGVERAESLFVDYLGAADTPYTHAVASVFLSEAIARAFHPGVKADYMPILVGPGGIGKSRLVRALAVEKRFFTDSIKNLGNVKTTGEDNDGKWIAELPELSGMNGRSLEGVKAGITRQADEYRESYARRTASHPRRVVYIGTTNEAGFIRERTSGARRFLPILCSVVEPTKDLFACDAKAEMKQVWAEVKTWMEQEDSRFSTRNVGVSSIVMAVIAALTFVVFTFPLAQLETPKSRRASAKRVIALLKQCFPLFVALFMYNLIDNMPKFVMEGALSYDNQLYYNALYFPAHAILLTSGFIYKPMLLKMANAWADPSKRKKFDLIIIVMFVIIVGITVVVAGAMSWFGLAIMSFLYGIDFEQYRGLCFVMLAAGGVTAGIEFLYQVITVLRRQRAVTKLYLITFGFSLFVPVLLVNFTGLPGAVIGYLIVMCILLVLLVSEYASIRMDLHRKLTGKAAPDAEMPRAARTGAMAPVQVAGAQAVAAAGAAPQAVDVPMQAQVQQAVAATQAQQTAAAQTAQAAVAQQANPAARGAHAPKASITESPTPDRSAVGDADRQTPAPGRRLVPEMYDAAPISWSAGGTVGIAQPEPEAPESNDEGEEGNA